MENRESKGLVSIIIPAYNAAQYVEYCLNSCLKQTYANIEIIVVDDGSKDNTLELAVSLAKEYPCIKVYHQENGGVTSARNFGLRVACGEWITFLDVDDKLCEDAVEVLLSGCEKNTDIVCCNTASFDNARRNDNMIIPRHADFLHKTGREGLIDSLTDRHSYTYGVVGKLFRADFLRDIAFVEGKRIHEDSFFMFECCMKEPNISLSDQVVYCVFCTAGSASRGGFTDRFLDILYFARRKQEIIASTHPDLSNLACNIWIKANMALLNNLCKTYDKKYKAVQRNCIREIRAHKRFFLPANAWEKKLFRIITLGLFPLYKRLNYFRLKKSF